jgi:hypothetical protein
VSFALLFPVPRVVLPSLWEAVAGEDVEPFAAGMSLLERRVWTWKDELPRRGLAWYGRFLAGCSSFLWSTLLRGPYLGAGKVDDDEALPLFPAAHDLARILARAPIPSAELRGVVGDLACYERAVIELQRNLPVTTAGVQEGRSGWPSAILELACRRFGVGSHSDHDWAVARFLDTVLQASVTDLAHAFGWPAPEARDRLEAVVQAGQAVRTSGCYVVSSPRRRRTSAAHRDAVAITSLDLRHRSTRRILITKRVGPRRTAPDAATLNRHAPTHTSHYSAPAST